MKTKFSRRDFLEASGALIVCFGASTLEPFAMAQGPFDTHPSHIDPEKLDSWLAVSSDGTVTAYTGKCDFGQGIYTAQTQLVAEELCVPISKVKLLSANGSDSRSGNDLRKSVYADQFQYGESGPSCCDRTRSSGRNGQRRS